MGAGDNVRGKDEGGGGGGVVEVVLEVGFVGLPGTACKDGFAFRTAGEEGLYGGVGLSVEGYGVDAVEAGVSGNGDVLDTMGLE